MFQVPANIESVSTRKDHSLKVVIGTRELSSAEKAILMDLHAKEGWFMFKENEFTLEDLPENDAPIVEGKSVSKRLHDRMLAYWISKNGDSKGFRTFYEDALDKIGQTYLDKIPK